MKNFSEWYNEHLEQHEIDPLFYVSSIASAAWQAGWNAANTDSQQLQAAIDLLERTKKCESIPACLFRDIFGFLKESAQQQPKECHCLQCGQPTTYQNGLCYDHQHINDGI